MNRSQEARSLSFQKLKPVCIKLSEIALRHDQHDPKELNKALEELLNRLRSLPILDAKLADYAFFPLSYVIKDAASITPKSLSLAVQCLEVLIKRGWQASTDVALGRELLVFLTIQIGKTKQDDLQLSILACLGTMLQCMNSLIASLFVEKEAVPLAGQLIDTLLEIIKGSPAVEIQSSAIAVLRSFVGELSNRELLQMFLPGLISQVSNILRPQIRRGYRVLVKGVEILELLVKKTLVDTLREPENDEDVSWRKATSSQILLALSNVIQQRYHDRSEVLDALAGLCTTILEDCQTTLHNCRSLLLETICIVSSQDLPSGRAALDRLVTTEVINSALQELVYKWLQNLPQRFQSSDESQVRRWVTLICEGYRALEESGSEITGLRKELLQTINLSARLILNEDKISKQVDDLPNLTVRDLVLSKPTANITALGSLDTPYLRLLEKLVLQGKLSLASEDGELYAGNLNLASLWTVTRSLSQHVGESEGMNEFVQVSPMSISGHILDTGLNQALSILTDTTPDHDDWRMKALSIEFITLVARYEKEEFRISLVDALFPLVELVGASNPFLRQYAITSLNAVSLYCGYTGPGDMIVQNVDYLVNAVALKFNSFDVSPQAVQVIVIMLELSGPALIPYLDDLVDSIFGVLAAYHGYPRLVEAMFSALAAIVKHGSSDASSIMDVPRIEHRVAELALTQVSDIPAILDKIKHPKFDEDLDLEDQADDSEAATQPATTTTELTKAEKLPKIYTMIESVLRLSQNYLTHREPYLRQKLLELITTGSNSLSRNEDSFLPLVNDIWPVVMQRLYDPEAIVSLAAMQTLSTIFAGAGDFVSTRVANEWSQIRSLFRTLHDKAVTERKGKAGRGIFSYNERLFDGIVDMLVQLIVHVKVKSFMEDDVFELLAPLARSRSDVRDALDLLNADALWLLLEWPHFAEPPPKMEGFAFVDVSSTGR